MAVATKEDARLAADYELSRRFFTHFLKNCSVNIPGRGMQPVEMWPHLEELATAWQEGRSQIIVKSRQIGLSWDCVFYALWTAMYKPGATVIIFSIGEKESWEMIDRMKMVYEALPEHLKVPKGNWKAGEISFKNNGRIMAFASTKDAGRSFTASLVIADEAASHPWPEENYTAYQPTIADGGQLIMVSTGKGANGFFYEMFTKSQAGETPYDAIFLPWTVRPSRDKEWLERQRSAFTGLPEEFLQEYPSSVQEAFIGLKGLVFPEFDRQLHVREGNPCDWKDYKYRVAGVDLGGGDPTAVIPLGITSDWKFHQPSEFYRKGLVTVDEIAGYLNRMHEIAPFWAVFVDSPPKSPIIAQLRALGVPAYGAKKDRAAQLRYQRWLIANNRLTINANCKDSIKEFDSYRWAERTDPHTRARFETRTPVDHHGDAIDARAYGILPCMLELRGNISEGGESRRLDFGKKAATTRRR